MNTEHNKRRQVELGSIMSDFVDKIVHDTGKVGSKTFCAFNVPCGFDYAIIGDYTFKTLRAYAYAFENPREQYLVFVGSIEGFIKKRELMVVIYRVVQQTGFMVGCREMMSFLTNLCRGGVTLLKHQDSGFNVLMKSGVKQADSKEEADIVLQGAGWYLESGHTFIRQDADTEHGIWDSMYSLNRIVKEIEK